jgi:hypothetical protein
MDPQSIPLPNGGFQRIWELQTYVEDTIRMAREQGLKFTFGSDARNADAGRLSYCKSVARRCGLTAADFYVPRRKTDSTPALASLSILD